ncbi:MAG TPA: M20/M25/M40 family metallo-hydrolase [Thermoanaerobaculia bacterium]|jgi:acetylornithine deacetylase/succinyl-diaminopimelate desuccinylase-like protein|nr:M20/M25/M40 family metallo-hydrolase [Thermoanaerobaculia bacterium]
MRRWSLPLALLITGVALIAGLRIYIAQAERQMASERLWIPKPATITPEVALLQQYVRIDTSNPPGNELPGAKFLADILEKNGVHAEIIESAPRRASVYARIAGKQHGDGLLLLNHIDVVPAAPTGWRHPPFAAEVELNQMYGRGTLDMKGIAICELLAFIDVARTHRTPERDIVFLAVADEESGGTLGTAWLLDHRPDVFAGIRYAINEGGITETTQERISYFGIEIGTKMTVRARLRARDRQSMQALRIALEPFMTRIDADRVLPEVRDFLHELAPIRVEQGQFLDNIDRTVATDKLWLLASGYRELTQNVVWAEAVESDGRGATMRVNLFNLPDENPDARIEWLRGIAARYGVTIEEVFQKSGPAPLSSRHTPMFALLSAEAKRQYGGTKTGPEVLAAWYNDSRYLRVRGIDAYGLMPFLTDWYQTQGIHSVDERVRIDWFGTGVNLLRGVVSRFAFEPLPPPAL